MKKSNGEMLRVVYTCVFKRYFSIPSDVNLQLDKLVVFGIRGDTIDTYVPFVITVSEERRTISPLNNQYDKYLLHGYRIVFANRLEVMTEDYINTAQKVNANLEIRG